MTDDVTTNITAFTKQIEAVIAVGRKTAAQVLNENAVKVMIGAKGVEGAVHTTKKATRADIRRDLNKQYSAGTGRKVGLVRHNVKLLYILASKYITKHGMGKGLRPEAYRALVAQVSEQLYSRRDQSRAYLAAGWLVCAKKLNPNLRGARGLRVKPDGQAAKSYSIPATPSKLTVACYNVTAEPGTRAGKFAEAGLNQAIANATADMEVYTKRKMEEAMARAAQVHDHYAGGANIRYA